MKKIDFKKSSIVHNLYYGNCNIMGVFFRVFRTKKTHFKTRCFIQFFCFLSAMVMVICINCSFLKLTTIIPLIIAWNKVYIIAGEKTLIFVSHPVHNFDIKLLAIVTMKPIIPGRLIAAVWSPKMAAVIAVPSPTGAHKNTLVKLRRVCHSYKNSMKRLHLIICIGLMLRHNYWPLRPRNVEGRGTMGKNYGIDFCTVI